jgi:streptomycin 6-kinase
MARGEAGRRWLADLDGLVAKLYETWGIAHIETLPGGTESYAAVVRADDGRDAVLKIPIGGDPLSRNEARTLRAAHGRGYAALLAYDEASGTMLLERLGSRLRTRGLSVERELEVLAALLVHAWEVPPDPELELLADKGRRLVRYIRGTWDALDRPCSPAVVDAAVAFAETRIAAPARDPVLLHGDAHADNALEADTELGYKLIDPDGLVGDRAYDLGILLRELEHAASGRERCALLASLTGVEADGVWEWGFVERVSTGLLCLEIGATAAGRHILSIAERWLDA